MKVLRRDRGSFRAIGIFLALSGGASAQDRWFVAPTGDDGNACDDPRSPCATVAGVLAKPGFDAREVILLAKATYTGTGNEVVLLSEGARLRGGWSSDFTTQSGSSILDGQGVRRCLSVSPGVSARLQDIDLVNGSSPTTGGGVFNEGELTFFDVVVRGCSSRQGGGIYSSGQLSLTRSRVLENSATSDAGGIFDAGGPTLIEECTVAENTAGAAGGGMVHSSEETMTILRSAVVFNSVSGEHGGGIFNDFVGEENPLVLINTTVFGNSAAENGGGIYVDLGPVSLTNCTVAGNEAGSEGGGIGPENIPNQISLANTIVAANEAPVGPDGSIAAVSLGNNLIGSTSGFPVSLLPSDLVGDPGFEDYTDDGTAGNAHVPLRADSRALNAGGDEACPSVDQLGTLRPQRGGCDIGAFELPGAPFPTTVVLDDFDQPDGPLGRTWQPRRLKFFDVEGGQLHVNRGGVTLWSRAFGAAQEAFVTFAEHDPGSGRQGLLLKVQKIPRRGAIAVTYFAPQKKVVIETFLPRRGWSELARSGVVEIDSGEQLGARVWPDGGVEVFIDGSLVLTARAEAFFDGRGGRIGLILEQAGGAVLDDFGGGNALVLGSSGI